jgi:NADH-quinone oxidoreductase subunit L
MVVPLVVLALLATGGGVFLEHYLPEYLSGVLPRSHPHPSLSPQSAVAASWIGLLGVALGVLFYGPLKVIPSFAPTIFPFVHRALLGKYFIDELYRAVIVRPLEVLSVVLWRGVDQGVIDATVNGTGEVVEISGEIARTAQTGDVRHYALYLIVAAATMIGVYLVF